MACKTITVASEPPTNGNGGKDDGNGNGGKDDGLPTQVILAAIIVLFAVVMMISGE